MTPITEARKAQFNGILDDIAQALDLSEAQVEQAIQHYKEIGSFLQAPESPLHKYEPEIFPQGSFRIGTMIKPIRDDDEYDIDLVCELKHAPRNWSQKKLKEEIGTYLKKSLSYSEHVHEERRRCWVLKFEGETHFHLDVLPAVPDPDEYETDSTLPPEDQMHALRITDNVHPNYGSGNTASWPKSNPVGYAAWFRSKIVDFENRRKMMSESLKLSVQEVPDWKVITPLQRAIQILKRHRDLKFGDDEDKPISIIITTLAGLAYQQESNVYDTLIRLLDIMPTFIQRRTDEKGQTRKWIPNPIDPEENFADKWQEYPVREENFNTWLVEVRAELKEAISANGLHLILEKLEKSFGNELIKNVSKRYGKGLRNNREMGNMFMNGGSGNLGATGRIKVENHEFFGKEEG